ncbi:MAG: hypothetical protein AABX89_02320 [Candidatus Thermoplasmatota archaeon]
MALVTDDFSLYHRLVPFFAKHHHAVLVLKPSEAVPASVRVLLGGPIIDPRSVALRDDLEATLLACVTHLDRTPGATGYRCVVLGVDPGNVLGLAAVADGRTLLVAESLSPESACERLAVWVSGLTADELRIQIGSGARPVGLDLIGRLRRRLPGIRLDLVAEHATTPVRPRTTSRHTDAAIQIALRSPA